MKYYYDTEFIEGFTKPLSILPTIGNFNKPIWQIQLISIGIVCEDGREYYAICKEFNPSTASPWVRENVLKKVYNELVEIAGGIGEDPIYSDDNLKFLLRWHGKSRKQIAQEIYEFVLADVQSQFRDLNYTPIDFYGYYADYDHVLLCTLYGTMMDLPNGFPMYTQDLQQMKDGLCKVLNITSEKFEANKNYPKQSNEHNALADARWNKQLHDYLQSPVGRFINQ